MVPQLSVIIPVYNASKYIERCVTSLMEQTLLDGVEFVFVDDGSTDDSVDIIREVANKYPERKEQVRIVKNEENQGVYLTRKRGIEEARGQYIGWCDSDDWVDKGYYEKLLSATNGGAIDIIVCDYTNIWEDHSSVQHYDIQSTPLECIERNYCLNSLPMELVIHLFRRDLILQAFGLIYPTGVGEDTYSIIHAYILAHSICQVATAGYYYDHRNEKSIINTHGHEMKDWLPHQYNIERITQTLYSLPEGEQKFHRSMNSMKYWRKLGYRNAFATEKEFYHTFAECYKDINIISHTSYGMRWVVYLLYNIYPLYSLSKKIGII